MEKTNCELCGKKAMCDYIECNFGCDHLACRECYEKQTD